jgi:hypothetical protein
VDGQRDTSPPSAASCKDIAGAPVTNWEPQCVTLAGYCYAVWHGMKFQLVTRHRVSHLQHYGVTVRGNVTSVYPHLSSVLLTLQNVFGGVWMDKECLLIYFVILHPSYLLQCDTRSHIPQREEHAVCWDYENGMPRRIFRGKRKEESRRCKDCVINEVIIVSLSQMWSNWEWDMLTQFWSEGRKNTEILISNMIRNLNLT